MDYIEFEQKLQDYTDYCSGDLSKKFTLEIVDEKISNFDFSRYDIACGFFNGDEFESCNFADTDFSSAFFSGSIFYLCQLENNRIVKAEWNSTVFNNCLIKNLYTFRAEFFDAKIFDCKMIGCIFKMKTFFDSSEFENTSLDNCIFENGSFSKAKISLTNFVDCRFTEQEFCRIDFVNSTLNSEEYLSKKQESPKTYIVNSTFYSCQFEKIHFADWTLCRDELQIFHEKPVFEDVIFKNCQFIDCDLPNDFDVEKAASSEGYCYSTPKT